MKYRNPDIFEYRATILIIIGFDFIKRTVEDAGPYRIEKCFGVLAFCISASYKWIPNIMFLL